LHDPAQVSRVDPQLVRQLACGDAVMICQLVQHPRLRQRVRTAYQFLVQHPDLLRVEAIERPDRLDALIHPAPRETLCAICLLSSISWLPILSIQKLESELCNKFIINYIQEICVWH